MYSASRSNLLQTKDEDLRQGEHHGQQPRSSNQRVYTTGCPRIVEHRVTDGAIAVERRDYQDVGRRIHDDDLSGERG